MRCLFCAVVVIGVMAAGIVEAAEPAAGRHEPAATCLTPVPAHVSLRSPDADVRAVLDAWEAAVATAEPVGKSERQRMEYTLRDAYSAHELALASEFRGPVRADELRRRYAWARLSHAGGVTRLAAEPRETAEVLFVPRFTIEFDDQSGLPRAVEFSRRTAVGAGEHVASTTGRIELDLTPRFAPEAPAQQPMLIQTVSHAAAEAGDESEAERILRRWGESMGSARSVDVRFERIIYDHVFQTERRSTGSLSALPDRFRYEIGAASAPDVRPSRRTDRTGEPYKVVADRPETWEISGNQIRIEDASGRVDEWTATASDVQRTTEPDAWSNFLGALVPRPGDLLPGIVSVSREEPLKDCGAELVSRRDSEVLLKLTARSKRAMAQFREVQVVLTTGDWNPKAVRSFDASGNFETVHILSDWRVVRDEPRRLVPPPPAEAESSRQGP